MGHSQNRGDTIGKGRKLVNDNDIGNYSCHISGSNITATSAIIQLLIRKCIIIVTIIIVTFLTPRGPAISILSVLDIHVTSTVLDVLSGIYSNKDM